MNKDIVITQKKIFGLLEEQRASLKDKPRQYVEDLLHESEDLLHSPTFSIRTAAEINRTAATLVLEERK